MYQANTKDNRSIFVINFEYFYFITQFTALNKSKNSFRYVKQNLLRN